jgi:ferric-dicitrate binding protein FerR (iron transport regulator)
MNIDDDLRKALRREPAPPDFAAKVLARTSRRPRRRGPAVLALAAALALAAVIPPSVHQYRQRQRALEARGQLMAALSITRAQLQQAKEKIRRNIRNK